MKIDSLLITYGIHKKDFSKLELKNYDKILSGYGAKANYYQKKLLW